MSQRAVLPEFDGRIMDGLLFSRKVYQLFNAIRLSPNGSSRMRLRNEPSVKNLLEELLPLAAFLQQRYNAGVQLRIRWHAGSQSYDAKLYQAGGDVEVGRFPRSLFVEVTNARHKNDYDDRWLIDKRGGSFGPVNIARDDFGEPTSKPHVWQNHEFIESMVSMIRDAVAKKTAKAYPPNTILLVCCYFARSPDLTAWAVVIEEIQQELRSHPFREVFLLEAQRHFTASIDAAQQ